MEDALSKYYHDFNILAVAAQNIFFEQKSKK